MRSSSVASPTTARSGPHPRKLHPPSSPTPCRNRDRPGPETIRSCITSAPRHPRRPQDRDDLANGRDQQLAARHGLLVFETWPGHLRQYKGRLADSRQRGRALLDSERQWVRHRGGVATNDDAWPSGSASVVTAAGRSWCRPSADATAEPGYAHRMSLCTAAVSLAPLGIVGSRWRVRDKMFRLLSEMLSPRSRDHAVPIPDYMASTRLGCSA